MNIKYYYHSKEMNDFEELIKFSLTNLYNQLIEKNDVNVLEKIEETKVQIMLNYNEVINNMKNILDENEQLEEKNEELEINYEKLEINHEEIKEDNERLKKDNEKLKECKKELELVINKIIVNKNVDKIIDKNIDNKNNLIIRNRLAHNLEELTLQITELKQKMIIKENIDKLELNLKNIHENENYLSLKTFSSYSWSSMMCAFYLIKKNMNEIIFKNQENYFKSIYGKNLDDVYACGLVIYLVNENEILKIGYLKYVFQMNSYSVMSKVGRLILSKKDYYKNIVKEVNIKNIFLE